MSQIIVKNLSIGYDGKATLENLNFTVEKGDYLCIIGDNGSGKTTLMKSILKLLPVIKGEILFSDGLKSHQIGYLPQQTTVQKDFPASVMEIVLSALQNGKSLIPFYTKKHKLKAEEIMKKVGINQLKKSSYRELSGGQQQRVLLARALMATNKVILLDEPTSSLDPDATAEFYELIKDLNKDEKITVIMISHDIAAAKTYANKILKIGSEMFFGSAEEYSHICSGCGKIIKGEK